MFIDRNDAAQQLIKHMHHLKNQPNIIVLAIPRGGLAIGSVVAQALGAPLDIILAKKIGAPYNQELAIGAVTQHFFFVDPPYKTSDFEQKAHAIQKALKTRELLYRQGTPAPSLTHKTVIIVDDGIATGQTMYAALQEIKKQQPGQVIIATPVISLQANELLEKEDDEIISVLAPADLSSIGAYYQQFEQVSDEEAANISKRSKQAKTGN